MILDGSLVLTLLIFGLRVLNNAIGTVRLISLSYGRRALAFVLAFIESSIFAFTASQVLTDFDNIPNLIAYSLGFAVGGYVGMVIEGRYVTGYMSVNVITVNGGHEIATLLREHNYGVTETLGTGGSGTVTMLKCVVLRQQVGDVVNKVRSVNPQAFITVEEARAVHRGWLRPRRHTLY